MWEDGVARHWRSRSSTLEEKGLENMWRVKTVQNILNKNSTWMAINDSKLNISNIQYLWVIEKFNFITHKVNKLWGRDSCEIV